MHRRGFLGAAAALAVVGARAVPLPPGVPAVSDFTPLVADVAGLPQANWPSA